MGNPESDSLSFNIVFQLVDQNGEVQRDGGGGEKRRVGEVQTVPL